VTLEVVFYQRGYTIRARRIFGTVVRASLPTKYFQTREGRLHIGRIAGLVYVVGLVPGCREFLVVEPLCLMRVIFTAGWWLSFDEKRPAHTLSEIVHPIKIIGVILILLGIAGQFYFFGHR
jgi:hypothetical protein